MTIYILDGAPASGKSTLLFGRSHIDPKEVFYNKCFKNLGYNVVGDSIAEVMNEIRQEGRSPRGIGTEILDRVVKKELEKFRSVKDCSAVYLFDKGLHGYGMVPKRLGGNLPKNYEEHCREIIYSSPIILFEPIPESDITKPQGRDTLRNFTLEDRYLMHEEFKAEYKKWGYEVIEVPIFSENKEKSLEERARVVKEIIGK